MTDTGNLGILALLPLQLLQFGLHMAILNGPMDYMGCQGVEERNQDCIRGWNPALASSSYALGGLAGSALAGAIVAYKTSSMNTHVMIYKVSAGMFAFGSLLLAWAGSLAPIVIARLFTGAAAGLSVVCCPILINKVAPPQHRGLCGSLSQLSINVGIIFAQLLGVFWANEARWRAIMYAALVIGLAGLALALIGLKNAPTEQANYSSQASELEAGDATPRPPATLISFLTKQQYRFALLCTVSIFVVQQATGINSIVQYGVRVMAMAVPDHAKLVNLLLSLVNLGMTAVGAVLIDKFGRKTLLLVSLSFTGLGTAALAFGLVRELAGFSVIAVLGTISAFAVGIGPIPFLYISEIAPTESVGIAQSVGTAASWLSTFAVLALFPALQNKLGASAFYIFSILTLASAIWYWKWLPRG